MEDTTVGRVDRDRGNGPEGDKVLSMRVEVSRRTRVDQTDVARERDAIRRRDLREVRRYIVRGLIPERTVVQRLRGRIVRDGSSGSSGRSRGRSRDSGRSRNVRRRTVLHIFTMFRVIIIPLIKKNHNFFNIGYQSVHHILHLI